MKRYLSVALIAAILSVTGCVSKSVDGASQGSAPADSVVNSMPAIAEVDTELAIETDVPAEPEIMKEPPLLRIEAVDEMVASAMAMCKGGYSWEYDAGDGQTCNVIADSAGPEACAEKGSISAKIDPTKVVKSPKVLLSYGGEITSVTCYKDGAASEVEFTAEGEITLPEDIGYAVFDVQVKFPQGNCGYYFITEIREDVPSGSGDSAGSVPPSEGASVPGYNPDVQTSGAYAPSAEPVELVFGGEYGLWDCPAKIYRTDGYIDGKLYPSTVVIKSAEELSEYFAGAGQTYQLGSMDILKYDEEFFQDNALVLSVIEEGSGSVSHKVLGMSKDHEIWVERNVPEIGTCDMAEYHIVVEIPAALENEEFRIHTLNNNAWEQSMAGVAEPVLSTDNADIVLLYRYTNYAWEKQDSIAVYYSNGYVYSIDLSDSNVGELDFEMVNKLYELCAVREPVGYADPEEIAVCSDIADEVNASAEMVEINVGCDMGQYTLYVVNGTEVIEICSKGDNERCLKDTFAILIEDIHSNLVVTPAE